MPQVNTFEDAIKVAIQHYFDSEEDDTPALSKLKPRKYNKKYFDKVATDMLPSKDDKPIVVGDKKTKP